MSDFLTVLALAAFCLIGLGYGWTSKRREKKLRDEMNSETWDDYLGV